VWPLVRVEVAHVVRSVALDKELTTSPVGTEADLISSGAVFDGEASPVA